MDERERRARAFVQRFLQHNPEKFSPEGNERFYDKRMEAADIDVLVALAFDGDKKALNVLRASLRLQREQAIFDGHASLTIPPSVRELMFEVFLNGEPRAKTGPKPTRNGQRNTSIALMVKWVGEGFGFPIYGNIDGRDNPDAPMSAIRLVGEET
jgi:hypothetical protein